MKCKEPSLSEGSLLIYIVGFKTTELVLQQEQLEFQLVLQLVLQLAPLGFRPVLQKALLEVLLLQ